MDGLKLTLISVRRAYRREKEDSVEKKVLGCAGFDAVAPIAIFLKADLKFEDEAVKGLNELKKQCGHIPEIKELSATELKEGNTPGVDFAHIYNRLYEMKAESYGTIAVDKYGAWGHIDKHGVEHWGDSAGFFPFYLDEKTLEKDLEGWDEKKFYINDKEVTEEEYNRISSQMDFEHKY